MNERIIRIRKKEGLSQEKFGEILGVSGAAISRIESGDRNITEQMLKAICREFNVSEEWLRNGSGDVYVKMSTDDKFAAALGKLLASEDEFVKNIIIGVAGMSEEKRAVLKKAAKIIKESNII